MKSSGLKAWEIDFNPTRIKEESWTIYKQSTIEMHNKLMPLPDRIFSKCPLSFSTSIYYLSDWRRCPNSIARLSRKRIKERSENRIRERDMSVTSFNNYTKEATLLNCQSVVFSSSK